MASNFTALTNGTLDTLNTTVNGQYSQSNGSEIRLIGSHFKNPLFVAPIVINAICATAFLVLLVLSWVRKLHVQESRKAFAVMMTLLGGMTLLVSVLLLRSARQEKILLHINLLTG